MSNDLLDREAEPPIISFNNTNISIARTTLGAYETQAKLFKVLMHPARLAILDLLREGEECVCHLEAYLGYRQAYISQQLMVLREAGLVEDRRDGWNIFYRVIKPEIYTVIEAAMNVTGEAISPIRMRTTEHTCTCPKCNLILETNT